ncbi:MAG: hypothetical protein Q9218_000742 [Villophora microphyllina]
MARSHESPMDFQWQQGFGPSGADSPFLKSIANNQSPPKSSFARINRPNSQSSIFPSTPSTKMPPQFRNPSFTTPQKSPDLDFSSGPENQSSPANGDTEETPEPAPHGDQAKNNGAMIQFRAEKKQPALGIFGRYGMSGRGEIQRRPHNDLIARRIHKRKRRDTDRDIKIARRRPSDGSESEGEDHGTHNAHRGQGSQQEVHQVGAIPAFFSYLETHPNLPHILSYYAQFLLNFFLVGVLIYIVYAFWSTIRSDVNEKSKEAASEILVEMAACARDFKENRCDEAVRVPAMESVCNSWEKCMQRDPAMVGRAKVSAHTFAEIINNFFQPISGKAMISLCVLFLGCLAVNNITMYLFRNKTHPTAPPPFPPSAQYLQPPSTLYTGDQYKDQFYTPYQHGGRFQPVEFANGIENGGRRSPVKRLQFR